MAIHSDALGTRYGVKGQWRVGAAQQLGGLPSRTCIFYYFLPLVWSWRKSICWYCTSGVSSRLSIYETFIMSQFPRYFFFFVSTHGVKELQPLRKMHLVGWKASDSHYFSSRLYIFESLKHRTCIETSAQKAKLKRMVLCPNTELRSAILQATGVRPARCTKSSLRPVELEVRSSFISERHFTSSNPHRHTVLYLE